ncbi:MAG TPA: SprT family zinc-dependent metalloprotease [Steroidobacteraceae bacterium]|nr:SprT family zinc-dependent metalloprotease [Steroidobacteraceae bacterium]
MVESTARSLQLPLFATGGAQEASWAVRTSRRARRLSVRVHVGGRVEIVVPPGVAASRVEAFVAAHRRWIAERVREYTHLADGQQRALPERLELAGFGENFEVKYGAGPTPPRVTQRATALQVSGSQGGEPAVAQALRRWLIAYSRPRFTAELDALAERTGLSYAGLQVRRQRTRWGSCSVRGTISVNVCLAFLPPELVRYLLLHELCHTRHMNHSGRFWALVERYEPGRRQLDRELSNAWRTLPWWIHR